MKKLIKKITNKLGFDLKRVTEFEPLNFNDLLKDKIYKNPLIFDIGGNKGQSIEKYLKIFHQPIIHSFEPNKTDFDLMYKKFKNNKNIFLNNFALGDKTEEKEFNITVNTGNSSFNKINALGISPRKQQAFDQAEYQSYQEQSGGYNPLSSYNPEYPISGARYNNTAISPFKTSFEQAVGSMKSGFQGMLGAFNDMTNDETNWNYRTSKAQELERRTNNLPSYISSVGDIDSWKDMGEYTVGLMGGMAPYLAAIAGGSAAAALTAPAWMPAVAVGAVGALPLALIYSGQTYNEMEGEGMEDRNAGMAFTAGTIMATLDRLGLHGLMRAGNTLKNNTQKTIAEAYQTKTNKEILLAKKKAMKKKGGIPVDKLENYSMMTFPMAALAVQKVFLKESAELLKGLVGLVDLPVTKQLLLKQTGGDIVQGMTREGATELGQEMTQYGAAVLGSEKEWVSSEAGDRALNALLGG